jgi:hypothetical protein
MESDTPNKSKKHPIHYVQRDLPHPMFAIVRMTWFSEFGPEQVDEVKIIDEGEETIKGFAEVMKTAIEGGAEVCLQCPYDPEEVGMYE